MSIRLPVNADDDDVYDTVDPNSEIIISNTFDPLDDSWPFHQEIQHPLEETAYHIITRTDDDAYFMGSRTLNSTVDLSGEHHYYQCFDNVDQQQHLGQDDQRVTLDKGLKKMKISTTIIPSLKTTRKKLSCSNKNKMRIITGKNVLEEGEGTSNTKKMDHNAKERIRRMKIKASYLALHQLLPDSRRSKKRRSAPFILDKVLKYIPEVEDEIQQLKSKKLNLESETIKTKKIDLIHQSDCNPPNNSSSEYQSGHTVSINTINQHEVVIQVCAVKREDDNGPVLLKNLLHRLEEDGEGICINSASMLCVCESRICYHLHVGISHTSSSGTDRRIQELRAKVSSIVAVR